jgi:hypothetical protein
LASKELGPAQRMIAISDHHEKTYTGTFDCLTKIIKSEGLFGLYKGFMPNWMRIGPHTVLSFFIFEQLRRIVGMDPV